MKIFACNKSSEINEVREVITELNTYSKNKLVIFQEIESSYNWKERVVKKFDECDYILFFLGENTFYNENLKWELLKAKKLNKDIVAIKLSNCSLSSIEDCKTNKIFDSYDECYNYLENNYEKKQNLYLEQYKIMVTSTEKVTDQRLKVNNLFFTVTSAILSAEFFFVKNHDFSPISLFCMILLTVLAFISTIYWKRLIISYSKLNTGKFEIINKLESNLNINMFQDEWDILEKKVKYESNSKTEKEIVIHYRYFIIFIGVIEFIAFIIKMHNTYELNINSIF